MSCSECLICCDNDTGTFFTAEDAQTLCQTLGLQDSDSTASAFANSYFPALLQSTYCSRCVGMIQDLGVVLMELEKLKNALKQGRLQIEAELKKSLENNNEKLKEGDSANVNDQNQDLRTKIINQLNANATTNSAVLGTGTVPKNYLKSTPLQRTNKKINVRRVSPKKLTTQERKVEDSESEGTSESESEDLGDDLMGDNEFCQSPSPSLLSNSFDSTEILEEKSDFPVQVSSSSPSIPTAASEEGGSKNSPNDIGLPVVLIRRRLQKEIQEQPEQTDFAPQRRSARMRERSMKTQMDESTDQAEGEGEDESQDIPSLRKPKPQRKFSWMFCQEPGCKYKCKAHEERHMKVHVRKIHQGLKGNFVCEEEGCSRKYHDIRQLRVHNYKCHKGPCPFVCPDCQEEFITYHAFHLHVAVTHKPEKIRFRCEVCNRGFVDRWRHQLHLFSHTKKRPVMCEHCSKTFNTAEILKHHQARHHPVESKLSPSVCNQCGKIYASPINLRGHMKRVHLKEIKHQCEVCGYGALSQSELKKHMEQRHSDERNYKCSACTASYKTKNALTIHFRSHTGDRPFGCKFCSKTFVDGTGLGRHELIHTKSQRHECEFCGKTFPLHNYLYVHLKSHKRKGETVKLKEKGPKSAGDGASVSAAISSSDI